MGPVERGVGGTSTELEPRRQWSGGRQGEEGRGGHAGPEGRETDRQTSGVSMVLGALHAHRSRTSPHVNGL